MGKVGRNDSRSANTRAASKRVLTGEDRVDLLARSNYGDGCHCFRIERERNGFEREAVCLARSERAEAEGRRKRT